MQSLCVLNGAKKQKKRRILMYKVGLYGGTFSPLHQGHVSCIAKATCMCEELYIIINHSQNPKEIDIRIRYRWLYQLTVEMKNVHLMILEDQNTEKTDYSVEQACIDANNLKEKIGKPVDIVFCGSDYDADSFWAKAYPESKLHIFERNGISSTQIRENPYGHWDWIPNVVKPYYNKKVLICGLESTGKSVLTAKLAAYYNTNYVIEAGRDLSEKSGTDEYMLEEDFTEILLTQKMNEMHAIESSKKVLFCDTNALYTMFYLDYFNENGMNDKNIELAKTIENLNNYDLIFLLKPTDIWVQDGDRKEDIRDNKEIYYQQIKDIIQSHHNNLVEIDGTYEERFMKCVKMVDSLLE